jgi:hypothetical protein
VGRVVSAVWRDATGALVGDWRVVLMGAPDRWVQMVGWGRMGRLGEDRALAERSRVAANLARAAVAAILCGRVVLSRGWADQRRAEVVLRRAGAGRHCAEVGRRCAGVGRRCAELVQRPRQCHRQPTAWAFEAAVAVVPTGPRQAVPGARPRERAGDPSAR